MTLRLPPVPTTGLVAATLLLAAACSEPERGEPTGRADPSEGVGQVDRQAEVAEAGAEVMPFDLDATTHVFEKLDDGGLQTVVADGEDPNQIALIREHLAEIAEEFGRGDFHDPATVHGHDMPGLHDLVMGHERMTVRYREVAGGGEIRYTSRDTAIVRALHQWFDAQVSDHGAHARAHR